MAQSDKFDIGYSLPPTDHHMVDLAGHLEEAQSHGVDSVEIPLLALNLICGGQVIEPQLRRLVTACSNRPLGYSVHAAIGINFADVEWRHPLHHQVAVASLDVCAALSARHMVVHSGMIHEVESGAEEAAYDRQRDALKRLGDEAAKRDIIVCVENVWSIDPKIRTALPSRLARELEAIDHDHVRATFDFSHALIQCAMVGADILQEAEPLIPYARHLHIHDSFGRPRRFRMATESEAMAFGVGDLHLPVGWGAVPWSDLMQAAAFPVGAVFNIELKKDFWPELAGAIAETRKIAQSARYH